MLAFTAELDRRPNQIDTAKSHSVQWFIVDRGNRLVTSGRGDHRESRDRESREESNLFCPLFSTLFKAIAAFARLYLNVMISLTNLKNSGLYSGGPPRHQPCS